MGLRAKGVKLFLSFIYDVQWFNKASQEEKTAADQQQAFAATLQKNYDQQLGQANASNQFLTQRLQQAFSQAQAGQGFTPAQEAALKSNNIEGQANATQQAQAATNRIIQQQGGGGGTTSGAAAQIAAQTARSSANQAATNNRNIDIANAQQAQSNLTSTGSLLSGLSGQQTSLANGIAGTAVNQSGNAFDATKTAYAPSNFWGNLGQGLLSGGINALAGVATGGLSSIGSGLMKGSSSSSNFGNPYGEGG